MIVSFDEVAHRMPFPLGNRWRLRPNGPAFCWAFFGGDERVTLTRSRARTVLPGHRCAIRDDRLADYKVCAAIVGGHSAFRRIRLISFQDFLSGPTSPSTVDRTRRWWKRHVSLSVSFPRSPRISGTRYGPGCETLHTFAPPVRRESANMHAALVLRLRLSWMDDRQYLVSSASRIVPAEARYNVSRLCPQPSIEPLCALLPRCSLSRLLRGLPHHLLRGSNRVPYFPSSWRVPPRRLTGCPARSYPERTVCLGPSACHERLSHCIGTHPTPFMSLESRSLFGSGCSCRLKTPGQGDHVVLAPSTLCMSDSRPKRAFSF